jgi:16S rRNA (guanine(966)-N(2))-methyltransferase RsmD
MRITGGILKGRQVKVPEGIIRPSMDRMRESVFACLGDLRGLSFLDLFSGTGIIALEAASRGASYLEAVESDSKKSKTLIENVKISPVRINCRFISAELYVKRAKRPFDLIFCDPPFPYIYKWELVKAIGSSKLMENDSLLLIHRPREDKPASGIPFLEKKDSREYGRSIVDFYDYRKNGDI